MGQPSRVQGWAIVQLSALVVAVVVGITLAAAGTDPDGIRAGIRHTARLSLVLLFPAFVASSTAELWRDRGGKWLLRNRKYFGLAFAVCHFTHLGLIAWFGFAYPQVFRDNVGNFGIYGGGTGYLFLIAMTITSFDGPRKWLGRRNWNILHKTGMYVFWGIFASSYLSRATTKPAFIPLATLIVAGFALRAAAWWRKRSRRRAKSRARAHQTA